MARNDDHGQGSHHIVPLSSYRNVLITLMILTVLTVVVAKPVSNFDMGIFNVAIAFGIASIKAALVMAIFMGLKYDKKMYLAVILTSVFFVVLLYLFSVLDIYSRVVEDSIL